MSPCWGKPKTNGLQMTASFLQEAPSNFEYLYLDIFSF